MWFCRIVPITHRNKSELATFELKWLHYQNKKQQTHIGSFNTKDHLLISTNSRFQLLECTIQLRYSRFKICKFTISTIWRFKLHEFKISTSRIHDLNITNTQIQLYDDFNFMNSRFQLHVFKISSLRIQDFNFKDSTLRLQLREFTISRLNLPESEILNSCSWNNEFVKLKSWICEFVSHNL
jgi:hypothetical protein